MFVTGFLSLLYVHAWLVFLWFLIQAIYVYGIYGFSNHLIAKETERQNKLEYEEYESEDVESVAQVPATYANPFVAFIKNDADFTYEAHLVNPLDTTFLRVNSLTWGIAGDSEGLMQTSKGVREKGQLNPRSSLLLEKDTRDGLDFVILYHLDMYEQGVQRPLLVKFNLPKGHWEYKPEVLPILNREGMIIALDKRHDDETIKQEITHLEMESSYKTNEELLAP